MSSLIEELDAELEALAIHREESPLQHIYWLPPQQRWLEAPDKVKLYRAGNQALGKTTAGLGEVIYRCLGEHPFLEVPKRAIEAWIICATWQQSLAIQEKLWDLLPKDLISPDAKFDKKNGFHANNPLVEFRNGSIIRFKTTKQGGLNLSSATIDVALFDEPPTSPRIFGEILKRIMKAGDGRVLMTLTPVNAPTEWLRRLTVEDPDTGVLPLVADYHARLEPANLIPVGQSEPLRLKDGTPCDAAFVDDVLRFTLPHEVPVVCHGEWEMRTEGNIFAAFNEALIIDELPDLEYELRFGTDHGHGGNFEEYALWVGVSYIGKHPAVYVGAEYVTQGQTTTDQDAEAILEMLHHSGITWKSLARAYGDRVYAGRAGKRLGKKSNKKLMKALADLMSLPGHKALKPQIRTVKRGEGHGAGSVQHGIEFLHEAMVRGEHFHVHRSCERLIKSLLKWDGRDNEWKHAIDTLRYSLDDLIFDKRRHRSRGPIYMYG